MNTPFRFNPLNPHTARDLRDSAFAAERLTPDGFDAYCQKTFRGQCYAHMIPEYMLEGLKDYIFEGTPPGDFLTAVLCNDLMEAVGRADDTNITVIPWYCGILYNYMPMGLRSNKEAIKRWIRICDDAREEEAAEKAMKTKWTFSDAEHSGQHVGVLEFKDSKGELHDFTVIKTQDRIVFGIVCNAGFLESGYLEREEGESLDEALQETLADLESYYNDGPDSVNRIIYNERM